MDMQKLRDLTEHEMDVLAPYFQAIAELRQREQEIMVHVQAILVAIEPAMTQTGVSYRDGAFYQDARLTVPERHLTLHNTPSSPDQEV